MAAVRPLKAKDQAEALTAVPQPPSLAERLAEAQKAAEPALSRLAELEQAKADALAREDGAALERIKDELGPAREAAAHARADVDALQSVIADIERQRAEDDRVVAEQRQKAEARAREDAARQREAEALEELNAEIAAVFAGLEAVKRTYRRALALQEEIGRARTEVNQARAVLGEIPAGMRAVTPNDASILQDNHPVLRELMRWAGPPVARPPAPVFVATAERVGGRLYGGTGGGRTQPSPWG